MHKPAEIKSIIWLVFFHSKFQLKEIGIYKKKYEQQNLTQMNL